MGASKYIKANFQKAYADRTDAYRARLSAWRKQSPVERLEGPTNPVAARRFGYKAKKEFIVIRIRTTKGKRRRRAADLGRKPGRSRKFVEPGQTWQHIAETRAWRRHRNLDVVGSYLAGQDGQYSYWEVILKDNQVRKANERKYDYS